MAARSGDPQSQEYAERLRVAAGAGVMFPGRVEDLPALLNALNLLVVASERETGPLVLLQALASGLPVVSTPVGRATELLPQDQLFPIGDIHSLAAKINHHLLSTGDPGAAGREARMLAESVLDVRFFHAAIRAQIDECLPVRARADRP